MLFSVAFNFRLMIKNQFKALNNETVRVVALELMEQNDTTTTLEVKNILRSMGFWAIQSDIAARMNEICVQERWRYTYNGKYRTYFLTPETAYLFQHLSVAEMAAFLEISLFSEN